VIGKYQAGLFDFDGTLADSYDAITASVNHVRKFRGLPELTEPVVRKLVGFGIDRLMLDIAPGTDPEENVRVYREHHPSVMFTHTRLLPGVVSTLTALQQRGVKLAICSNKPSTITRQLVHALKLNELIPFVLGPEDCGAAKPAPAMLLTAMERLQVTREQTFYVGDMTIDIETAKAASVPVWVIATGSDDIATLEKAKPNRILSKFEEIIDLAG
jgi:phosphoglycolate phosphatase